MMGIDVGQSNQKPTVMLSKGFQWDEHLRVMVQEAMKQARPEVNGTEQGYKYSKKGLKKYATILIIPSTESHGFPFLLMTMF